MSRARTFLFYWLPLVIYLILIFVQSAFPAPQTGIKVPHLDKGVHAAMYGLLGILFCRAYGRTWPRMGSRWLTILSILSAAVFGLSDEIHQYFVPYRSADRMDLLADFLGSAVGVLIYRRATAGEIYPDQIRD
ncbi:MAG: VanZ family protein [Thermodesulfobacteriota bacterium]